MKHTMFVPLLLAGALSTVLLPPASVAHGQNGNAGPIHMVGILADMQKTVDAKKAKPGEMFTAKTIYAATLNDGTVVPKGSLFEGHVVSATPSEHHSDSTLVVTIDKLKLKDGKEIPVKAVVMNVSSLLSACSGCGFTQDSDLKSQRIQGGPAQLPDGEESQVSKQRRGNSIQGLTVTSSVTGSDSGTFTQKKKNVHLDNEDELGLGVAVVPKGVILEK